MNIRNNRTFLTCVTAILAATAFSSANATPETVALEILARQIAENQCNVQRWSWLAHKENNSGAFCPTSPLDGATAESFKDRNEKYFEDRAQRATDAQQSWQGLGSSARTSVNSLIDPLLNAAPPSGTGLDSKLVANAYQSGAASAVSGLGLGTEADATDLISAILSGTFSPTSTMFGSSGLVPLKSVDIVGLQAAAQSALAAYTKLGANENVTLMAAETKLRTDNQKTHLRDLALVAEASRLRREAIRALTQKLLATGATDQGKIAEYEFYLAAMDALAREATILSRANQMGTRAEDAVRSNASNAAYLKSKLGH